MFFLNIHVSSHCIAECRPLSYDTCRDFAIQFDRLYNGRNKATYDHPNPMHKTTNTNVPLDYSATDKVFFDNIQFPVGYNFPQEDTGVVDRSFEKGANSFHGDK